MMLTMHEKCTRNNDGTVPMDILEFLKTTRTIVNQMNLLQSLDISPEHRKVTENAARTLLTEIRGYVEGIRV